MTANLTSSRSKQRTKDDEVLEREGLETELMEHGESEAGEDIHHAG